MELLKNNFLTETINMSCLTNIYAHIVHLCTYYQNMSHYQCKYLSISVDNILVNQKFFIYLNKAL